MKPAANIAENDRKEDWIEADSFGVSVVLEVVPVIAVLEPGVPEPGVPELGVEVIPIILFEYVSDPLVQEVLIL
jgi:hypothetical protein